MPCKHEGGTDPCERNSRRQCRAYGRQAARKWRSEHPEYRIQYHKQFNKYASCKATACDAGEAGELLVAADLLTRGLSTTKPYNRNGKDDLHFKSGKKWFTVQVKLGVINVKTGTISQPRSLRDVTSDIVALVALSEKKIRYVSRMVGPLPPELQE